MSKVTPSIWGFFFRGSRLDCLNSRVTVDFRTDMVNPRSSAHAPILDEWSVKISAICGMLESELGVREVVWI